ncbi:MAG TPA: hypothetical protein VEH04_16915 [Verrucomicrobiae bacterium]|nr:hypothetical protein [Verrucomicrobiae bacterium]
MRRRLLSFVLAAFLVFPVLAEISLEPKTVTLLWDPHPQAAEVTIVVYHSTDLLTWEKEVEVPGTQSSVSFEVVPGAHYYRATAKNFWGESDFSNVASTPSLPVATSNLQIRLGN